MTLTRLMREPNTQLTVFLLISMLSRIKTLNKTRRCFRAYDSDATRRRMLKRGKNQQQTKRTVFILTLRMVMRRTNKSTTTRAVGCADMRLTRGLGEC